MLLEPVAARNAGRVRMVKAVSLIFFTLVYDVYIDFTSCSGHE